MKREHIWVHHELDATRYWKQAEGGYADRMSVRQGESIDLHISNSRSCYDVEIMREGARRETVATIENLQGALHEIPEDGYSVLTSYEGEIPRKMLGRGGTDFRPPFQFVEDKSLDISTLVYFTDGMGTFPEEPPYPTAWVMTTDVEPPFGEIIRYER